VRRWLLDDAPAEVTRSCERCIDVRHTHFEEMSHDTGGWRDLIAANVGDDDGAVRADAQLSPVRVADAHAFLEAEGGVEPGDGRSHIRIDQYRRNGRGRCRAIRQHGR
jgi:hypothetical protein